MPTEISAELEARAKAAGLGQALAAFPADVLAAAEAALAASRGFKRPESPLAEPWPPMRAGYPA